MRLRSTGQSETALTLQMGELLLDSQFIYDEWVPFGSSLGMEDMATADWIGCVTGVLLETSTLFTLAGVSNWAITGKSTTGFYLHHPPAIATTAIIQIIGRVAG